MPGCGLCLSAAVAFSTGSATGPFSAPRRRSPPASADYRARHARIGASATPLAPSSTQFSQNDSTESGANGAAAGSALRLNGVTVNISARRGPFFVSPGQSLRRPPGLVLPPRTRGALRRHNNCTVIRARFALNPAQPTSSPVDGEGVRAAVLNVTNPCIAAPCDLSPSRPRADGRRLRGATPSNWRHSSHHVDGPRGPVATRPCARIVVDYRHHDPAAATSSRLPLSHARLRPDPSSTLPEASPRRLPVVVTITRGTTTTARRHGPRLTSREQYQCS